MCYRSNKNGRFSLEFLKLVVSLHRKNDKGKYQSGQMGQTVNLLAYAFGGSNPSLPTNLRRNCGIVVQMRAEAKLALIMPSAA